MRVRSGTVVVGVVLAISLTLGSLGAWWVVHARPRPGEFIDVLATADGAAVVVRRERSSDRSFVEVYDGERLRWRGMIPHYAGRPGAIAVAASPRSITVRVVRGGHPYLFAFDAATGAKIDSFDLVPGAPPDPDAYTLGSLATVSDGHRGAELLAAPGGGIEVIGVDLDQRRLAWKRSLPGRPLDAWIAGDLLVLQQVDGKRALALADGADAPAPSAGAPAISSSDTSLVPARNHVGGGRIWVVTPRAITVLDAHSLQPVATLR